MKEIYKLGFALVFVLLSTFSEAQHVTPATFNVTGSSYVNADSYYQFEWSVGELTTIDPMAPPDSLIFVMHGVLQPCTDKIGKSPLIVTFEPDEIKLFPNPTSGKFEMDFFVRQTGRMEIQLTDVGGKVLQRRSYPYNGCCRIEHFDLTSYQNGVYFVITTLYPDMNRAGDGASIVRHSGFRVIKAGTTR